MSEPNYTLDIISHHSQFKNKKFNKFHTEGIDTIGVWGNEPFELVFTNNTWQKIQVKLSIDGTDILTGGKATTDASAQMWIVNAKDKLSIKAWPETIHGGAQLVFTSTNNSVAVHTHGDLSSRGIIAAAVFVEGEVKSPTYIINTYPKYYPYYPYYPYYFSPWEYLSPPYWIYSNTANTRYSCDGGATYSCNSISTESKSLDNVAAVGAGQYVEQEMTYSTGLIKPILTETIRVRFLWWDDLVSKLKDCNIATEHASGFPGNIKQNIMSLGNTPRIGNDIKYKTKEINYVRIL